MDYREHLIVLAGFAASILNDNRIETNIIVKRQVEEAIEWVRESFDLEIEE